MHPRGMDEPFDKSSSRGRKGFRGSARTTIALLNFLLDAGAAEGFARCRANAEQPKVHRTEGAIRAH